jgi:hypothetical protein
MSKTKTLALSAFVAILFACGSQDGSPPELKNKQLGTISPYDTLVAEFDSEIIDIDKLGRENIDAESHVKRKSIRDTSKTSLCFSKKVLCLIGDKVTDGGAPYFDEGITEDSIIFRDLKNSNGTRKYTALRYSTHKIFDIEPNDMESSANDIETFGKVVDGVTFAGILDKEVGTDGDGKPISDTDDYYKLYLTEGDRVYIKASNQGNPFSFRFYGPCPRPNSGCNDTTIRVDKKVDSLQTRIESGYLQIGSTVGTPGTFYIRVFDRNLDAKPTPYLITVKVTK